MATFTSGGATIRIDQHEPGTPGPHPAILLVHGSGGNVTFWLNAIAPYLSRLNVALYAVHYFNRTATTRADPATILDGVHFPLWLSTVADAVAYIRARPAVDARRVALLGISLGAFLSLSLAAQPDHRLRAVIEISGGLPAPFAAQATSCFPPTLIVHGEGDTVVPVSQARDLDALLTGLSVPHQLRILAGQGHWFDSAAQLQILLAAAQFLSQHL